MGKWILCIVVLLLSFSALSKDNDFAKQTYPITGESTPQMNDFDKAFIRLMKTWHIPGAAVAIVRDDKVIFNRGYGWANILEYKPVQPDSLFRIASISKAITGVTILKLIEEKKLKLDDKIFDILSDLKPAGDRQFNQKQKNITVRDLLYMSSGWIAGGKYHIDPMFGPWPKDIVNILGGDNLPASCADMTSVMMTMPLRSAPGSGFAYSNLDYCVLGLLVSKIHANRYDYKGYEQYVQDVILKPLNITDMHIGTTYLTKVDPREVVYYRYLGNVDISNQAPSTYFPYGDDEMLHKNFANGGWVASAPDLARFVYHLGQGNILSEETLALMKTPPRFYNKKAKQYFSNGWKFKTVKKQQIWYQTGSFTGTSAVVIRKPDNTAIAVIFNSRPPIYHMWKDFRPKLYRLFKADMEDDVYQTIALLDDQQQVT